MPDGLSSVQTGAIDPSVYVDEKFAPNLFCVTDAGKLKTGWPLNLDRTFVYAEGTPAESPLIQLSPLKIGQATFQRLLRVNHGTIGVAKKGEKPVPILDHYQVGQRMVYLMIAGEVVTPSINPFHISSGVTFVVVPRGTDFVFSAQGQQRVVRVGDDIFPINFEEEEEAVFNVKVE